MDVLLIINGVVDNCICADSTERAQQFYPFHTCMERTPELAHIGVGHTYDGTSFTAPPPAPLDKPFPISRVEFMRRFADRERLNIRAAAKTDPIVEDAMDLLSGAEQVHLDDTDVIRFVGYLATLGLIATDRVSVILGS